jgi:hypothetical protein
MKLINLCEYTLRQSLSDTGKYPKLPFITAQELIDDLNNEGGNK